MYQLSPSRKMFTVSNSLTDMPLQHVRLNKTRRKSTHIFSHPSDRARKAWAISARFAFHSSETSNRGRLIEKKFKYSGDGRLVVGDNVVKNVIACIT